MMNVYLLIFITEMTTIAEVDCRTSEIKRTALIERTSKQTGRSRLSPVCSLGYLAVSMLGDSEIACVGSVVSIMCISAPLASTAIWSRIKFLQQAPFHCVLNFYCKNMPLERILNSNKRRQSSSWYNYVEHLTLFRSVSTPFECRILYLALRLLYWNALYNIHYIYIYIWR